MAAMAATVLETRTLRPPWAHQRACGSPRACLVYRTWRRRVSPPHAVAVAHAIARSRPAATGSVQGCPSQRRPGRTPRAPLAAAHRHLASACGGTMMKTTRRCRGGLVTTVSCYLAATVGTPSTVAMLARTPCSVKLTKRRRPCFDVPVTRGARCVAARALEGCPTDPRRPLEPPPLELALATCAAAGQACAAQRASRA